MSRRRAFAGCAAVLVATFIVLVGLQALNQVVGLGQADLRVNVAGRQRALTERIAVEVLLSERSADAGERAAHRAATATAAEVLLSTERALEDGGPLLRLDGTSMGEVLEVSEASGSRVRARLLDRVDEYVAAARDPAVGADELARLRSGLVDGFDQATTKEQGLAAAGRDQARRALVAGGLAVLLAVVAALLVRSRSRQRRAALGASRAAEARFRALVTGAREGVLLLRPRGGIDYASPACRDLGLDWDGESARGSEALGRWLEPEGLAWLLADEHDEAHAEINLTLRGGRVVRALRRDERDDPDLRATVVHLRDVTAELASAAASERRHASVRLLQESAAAANRSANLEEALRLVLAAVCNHFGWRIGHAYIVRRAGDPLTSTRLWAGSAPEDDGLGETEEVGEAVAAFRDQSERCTFDPGIGLPGRVLASGRPLWVPDVTRDPNFPRAEWARQAGLGAAAAFPLLLAEEVIAVLEFFDTQVLLADDEVLEIMGNIGRQLGRVVERERAETRLLDQARTDELTGLLNRRSFKEELATHLAEPHDDPVVAYLDLDDFKDVNDTLGHAAGDQVLVTVAQRLRAAAPTGTPIARLGGDEFALLLAGPPERAAAAATDLLDQIRLPFWIDQRRVQVSGSIGLTWSGDVAGIDASDWVDELLVRADIALYAAKAQGRAHVVGYDESLGEEVRARKALDDALRRAARDHEFSLVFQPIADAVTGEIRSCEALLRWPDGDVGPDVFVPLLEASGLIVPVGAWVLRTACTAASRWLRAGSSVSVSVNVSPLQLTSEGFVDEVVDILAESSLRPEHLILEVTESAATDVGSAAVLTCLRGLGITVAVDDFGTGYSSLSRLVHLPTSYLKLDMSLVRGIGTSDSADSLVRAAIDLAHHLDLTVVAEGVETDDQLEALVAMGCDRIQGYLIGRPGSVSDMVVAARASTRPEAAAS